MRAHSTAQCSASRQVLRSAICLLSAALPVLAIAPLASASPDPKVRICHRTLSATNPYVSITVAQSSVDGSSGASSKGAGDHFTSHPEDIIPPIAGFHDGLNWNAEGIAIWAAGCRPAKPADTDRDGLRDIDDTDDDGDGIPDTSDIDDDGDDVQDSADPDQGMKSDTDQDGIPDSLDPDDDGDGLRDSADPDRDGNDVPDAQQQGLPPAADDPKGSTPSGRPGDQDRDGKPDATDPDQDGDGKANSRDADADDDGVPEILAQHLAEPIDLPAEIEARDSTIAIAVPARTVEGQRVTVTVRCAEYKASLRSRAGAIPAGDLPSLTSRQLCAVDRSGGNVRVRLRTDRATDVNVRVSAPAHDDLRAYAHSYETRVKPAR
jgi:hypothetical protein